MKEDGASSSHVMEVAEEATEYFRIRSFSCSKDKITSKENCQKDKEDPEVVSYSEGDLEDHYEIGPIIGKGGYGTVYIGQRKRNKEKVILKHIPKWKILQTNEVIMNE